MYARSSLCTAVWLMYLFSNDFTGKSMETSILRSHFNSKSSLRRWHTLSGHEVRQPNGAEDYPNSDGSGMFSATVTLGTILTFTCLGTRNIPAHKAIHRNWATLQEWPQFAERQQQQQQTSDRAVVGEWGPSPSTPVTPNPVPYPVHRPPFSPGDRSIDLLITFFRKVRPMEVATFHPFVLNPSPVCSYLLVKLFSNDLLYWL